MYKQNPKPNNLIYGIHSVIEAIEAGQLIDKIMVQKGEQSDLLIKLSKLAKANNYYQQQVPKEKLNKLYRGNHQGVIAFTSPIDFQPIDEVISQTFEKGKTPFIVALDGVTDVKNFGAIVRTAHSAGVDAIMIPFKGSAACNEDAIKTSAGALFHIPICKVKLMRNSLKYLQNTGIQVISVTEKTGDSIFSHDYTLPTCLVLGAEDVGISADILKISDKKGALPMLGKVGSLNVSVAAGVTMYEVVKQRL
jgi:23S rRNA (guanosine2251-2'-O)-methyltransferase|tara:strand:- start:118 stop:867 length:750 start_codon:yes stop_codon:yes gene_type:complete